MIDLGQHLYQELLAEVLRAQSDRIQTLERRVRGLEKRMKREAKAKPREQERYTPPPACWGTHFSRVGAMACLQCAAYERLIAGRRIERKGPAARCSRGSSVTCRTCEADG